MELADDIFSLRETNHKYPWFAEFAKYKGANLPLPFDVNTLKSCQFYRPLTMVSESLTF